MQKVLLCFIYTMAILSAESYEIGNGYQITDTPLYLGGYFSFNYSDYNKENIQETSLDDLALLSYGSYDKFSYMVEMEFKDLYVKRYKNGQKSTTQNRKLYAERLYFDYHLNENFLTRVGKYNSNIGYWNLTPINVLRDTTSSPATASIIFPEYTTGADMSYHLFDSSQLIINLTIQNNHSLDEEYNNFYIEKHFGIGIEYSYDDLSIKLNGGYFHKREHTQEYVDNYYTYLSFLYNHNALKLMGAIGHRDDDKVDAVNIATYLQATYEINSHHYPVVRIEYYDTQMDVENSISKDSNIVLGYTYRPIYPVALKIEYQLHSNRVLDKILASFSVMF